MLSMIERLLTRIQGKQDEEHKSQMVGVAVRRSATSRRLWRKAAGKPRGWKPAPFFGEPETRQQLRAAARQLAFLEITEKYPGEPRSARRRMALTIARRSWKQAERVAA